ncbi:MAG: UvrD-helicase domain-containing protein [Aeriscardovia sp.]|nr:UvrD-helicase domain-containing protein [Aeriscardovia sp.]
MSEKKIVPTPEQREIIEDKPFDTDMLIIAGAGSGKTFTMTQRIVELITARHHAEKPVDPGAIMGLTFTRKAAEELAQRVGSAVLDVRQRTEAEDSPGSEARAAGDGMAGPSDPSATDRSNPAADRLLGQPSVATYDSFFQQIVRRYGLLIGVDPQTTLISTAGRYQLAAQVVSREFDKVCERLRRPDPDGLDAGVPRALPLLHSGQFGSTGLVEDVCGMVDECLQYMLDMDSEDHTTFASAIGRVRRWNDTWTAKLRGLLLKAKASHADYDDIIVNPDLTPSGKPTKPAKKNLPKGLSKAEKEELFQSRQAAYEELFQSWQAADAEWEAIRSAKKQYDMARKRAVVVDLAEKYQDAKRANGFAEYPDYTAYAFQLVQRFPSIGEEYRRRYRYVFLDEYQDTSTTQALLLAALFHPERPVDAHDRPSNVTAVGDPFQSVYAFRGSSPDSFKLFVDRFHIDKKNIQKLSLTKRNRRLVLDCANRLTDSLREEQEKGRSVVQVAKLGAMGESAAADAGSASLHEPCAVAVAGYSCLKLEAEAIKRFVDAERPAREELQRPGDPLPPIAVLLRTKKRMPVYLAALESLGLTCQATGASAVMDTPETQDLLDLLTVCCDATNSVRAMRLLASPRYHLQAADLDAVARFVDEENEAAQYKLLVEAGLAPHLGDSGSEADEAQRRAQHKAVQQHRGDLPADPLVNVNDVLRRGKLETALKKFARKHDGHPSASARRALKTVSQAVRTVESCLPLGVEAAVRAAVSALDLDADLAVAQLLAAVAAEGSSAPGVDVSGTSSKGLAAVQSLVAAVGTYKADLMQGQDPTLPGFLSWLDSSADAVEQSSGSMGAAKEPDVVLMTIHAAKGLEWPAVVVADMKNETFPPKNSVSLGAKARKGMDVFQAGDIAQTPANNLWIESPARVPAPLRSDAASLPSFPQNAARDSEENALVNPVSAIEDIDSLEQIMDELDAEPDTDGDAQSEARRTGYPKGGLRRQYGRRAYSDELHLLYVAVTRSQGDVLLTYSAATKKKSACAGTDGVRKVDATGGGVFWKRAKAFLEEREASGLTVLRADVCGGGPAETTDGQADASAAAARGDCHGIVAATDPDRASRLYSLLFGAACRSAVPTDFAGGRGIDPASPAWPTRLRPDVQHVLDGSADRVRQAQDRLKNGAALPGGELTRRAKALLALSSQNDDPYPTAEPDGTRTANTDSATDAGSSPTPSAELLDKQVDWLQRHVREAMSGRSISTTRLQRLLRPRSQEEYRGSLLEILRPMPQPPASAAEAGTLFHTWVASFLDHDLSDTDVDSALTLLKSPSAAAPRSTAQHPAAEPLAAGQTAGNPDAADFHAWQKAFLSSQWRSRTAVSVEREYDIALPCQRLAAKMDAVFAGRLADKPGHEQAGAYTIVDWKTGSRPRDADQQEIRLLQLDIYRLAFSLAAGVDIADVDACLFYVSEKDPALRQIDAQPRTADEIAAEIVRNPRFAAAMGPAEDLAEERAARAAKASNNAPGDRSCGGEQGTRRRR